MADATVLKEFLISLGYRVDESSQRKFDDSMKSMGGAVEKLGLGLVALASGFLASVEKMAAGASKMAYLADYIGTTVKDFHAISFAAGQLGVSVEAAMSQVQSLGLAMKDNIPAQKAWASALGGDTSGTMGEQLARLGQRMAGMNEAQRQAQFQFLSSYGLNFSPEMRQAIQNPKFSSALREGQKIEEEFPGSAEFAEKSKAYEAALVKINTLFERIKESAGNVVVDHVTNGMNIISKWVEDHHEDINKFFKDLGIDFGKLGPAGDVAAAGLQIVTDKLGGMHGILQILETMAIMKFLMGGTVGAIGSGLGGMVKGLVGIVFGPGAAAALGIYLGLTAGKDHMITKEEEEKERDRLRAAGPKQTSTSPRSDDPNRPARPLDNLGEKLGGAFKSFWEWIVPSAHADEIPPQLRQLNENLETLNGHIEDKAKGFGDGLLGIAGSVSQNLTGFTGTGPRSGGGTGSNKINWQDPKVIQSMKYFMDNGYSMADASAIVANLWSESNLNPQATNSSGMQGIAQWDTSRRKQFHGMFGHDPNQGTLDEQNQFINWELHNTHKTALQRMQGASDVEGKTKAFYDLYEAPGAADTTFNQRLSNAQALGSHVTPSIMSNVQNSSNSADRAVHNEQHIVNNVHGMRNADDAAKTLKDVQERHWADMVRNVSNPVY